MKQNIEKEIFRDIPGYEGLYQVSSEGRVKSLERYLRHSKGGLRISKERDMLQSIRKGYGRVTLCIDCSRKTYSTHVLVAMAFLSHTPSGHDIIVDHINNDRSDNRLINLQLISNRENISKDRKPRSGFTGAYKIEGGKYQSEIYDKGIRYRLGVFDTPEEAHQAYLKKLKEIIDNNL